MKLASYNVENLFLRPVAMNQATWAAGQKILTDQAALNAILGKPQYSTADKTKIVTLLTSLGLDRADENKFVLLRRNRGKLIKRSGGTLQVIAGGRGDWVGWVELQVEQVTELAIENTARIVKLVDADVIGVVEAESRPALKRFSDELLPSVGGTAYRHVMLIDGNDERGIDVGIMTRGGFTIGAIRSHVDDRDAKGVIFSRDCAEYDVTTPQGNTLVVLVNHLKSKGYGAPAASNAKRLRQAQRIADIYKALVAGGQPNVAVIGDLNDTPDSAPLAPLLVHTDLQDITAHPNYQSDGRPGTWGNGSASQKLDYILLSPALFARVDAAGVNRMGVWGGVNGTLFPHLPEIQKESDAASDHAALWVDLDL